MIRLVAALVLHSSYNYVFMLFILWHSKIIYFVRLNYYKCSFSRNNKSTRRKKLNINAVNKQTF